MNDVFEYYVKRSKKLEEVEEFARGFLKKEDYEDKFEEFFEEVTNILWNP